MTPPVLFAACLVGALALDAVAPGPRVVGRPWSLAGVPVALAGVWLHARAWRHFGRRGAPLAALAAPAALVTDGPFARTRNPMYLAGVVILVGLAVLLGSATPFLAPAVFGAVARVRFIAPEERLLARTHGDAYRDYRSAVRRWL